MRKVREAIQSTLLSCELMARMIHGQVILTVRVPQEWPQKPEEADIDPSRQPLMIDDKLRSSLKLLETSI